LLSSLEARVTVQLWDVRRIRCAMISTLPPTQCGLATFAQALSGGFASLGADVDLVRVLQEPRHRLAGLVQPAPDSVATSLVPEPVTVPWAADRAADGDLAAADAAPPGQSEAFPAAAASESVPQALAGAAQAARVSDRLVRMVLDEVGKRLMLIGVVVPEVLDEQNLFKSVAVAGVLLGQLNGGQDVAITASGVVRKTIMPVRIPMRERNQKNDTRALLN